MEQVIKRIKHPGKFWIGFQLDPSQSILMLGLETEKEANEIMQRYRETGTMENVHAWMGGDQPKEFKPILMMKLSAIQVYGLTASQNIIN
jgi:hypothetical protein